LAKIVTKRVLILKSYQTQHCRIFYPELTRDNVV